MDGSFESFEQDFADSFDLALQQMDSKFMPHVTMLSPVKADGAQIIDHVMPFEANVRSGSDVADTKLEDYDTLPRWAFPIILDKAIPVTNTERLSMLKDPTNSLTQSFMAAFYRALDTKIIIPAMFRDVTAGANKDTTKALPAGNTIAVGSGSDAALTRAKIEAVLEKMESAEIDTEAEMPCMAISPRQHRNLRNIAEVKNVDFINMGGVMEKGRVKEFLGCKVFVSNKLTTDTSGNLEVPVWVPSGIAVQPWLDPKVRISERPDKNYITQIYCEARWGATRTEEERVYKVLCDESTLIA